MRTSSEEEVRALYEDSADWYAKLMDSEIDLPIYDDTLGRLADRIQDLSGPVIDTSCGPGHMLTRYHERYDPNRFLVGIDLSPRMVAIAESRLGADAVIIAGDMREMLSVQSGSAAAVISFFAIHHVGQQDVLVALQEWRRVLRKGGQLLIAAWEGEGAIDYGDESNIVALRYRSNDIVAWVEAAGFVLDRCVVEPVKGMSMDAVYLEGTAGEHD